MELKDRVALVAGGAALLGVQRALLKRAATVEDVADQALTCCKSDSVTGPAVSIGAGVFFH